MNKSYIQKIKNLMHADFITMNGGKQSMKTIAVILFIFFGGLGFAASPLAGLYVPIILGGLFVPMLFHNEMKYKSEKMYSILPIERRDLVRSRFIISVGLYFAVSFVFYLLMLLSMKLGLYLPSDGNENFDALSMLINLYGGGFTKLGMFNLLYFAAFSFGLIIMSGNLRKYFRNSEHFAALGQLKKAKKEEYFLAALIFSIIILLVLTVSGILPFGTAVSVINQLLSQLANAANGFLLGAVLIAVAVMSMIYKYTCTILEYDKREM